MICTSIRVHPLGGGGAGDQTTLEVDVVVDLLLTVGRCYGEQQQQWPRVLRWFEGVAARSGGGSFSFVTAMFSSQQKAAMREVLGSVQHSCSSRSGDGVDEDGPDNVMSLIERIEKVKSIFELN